MTAPFILSIKSVFTPEQQPRSSAHKRAFAEQTHQHVGLYPQKYLMRATGGVYLGFDTFGRLVFCEVRTQL